MQLDEWLGIGIPDEVMEQASAWLARLDADHVSLDERQRLSVWLDEDPLHRWAFEELSLLYARAATLSRVRGQIDAPKVMIFPHATPRSAPHATSQAAAEAEPARTRGGQWQFVIALLLIAVGLSFAVRGPIDVPPEPAPLEQPRNIEQTLTDSE